MVTPHAFNYYSHRLLQFMEIRMKPANFVLFLIAVGFSTTSADDSSENFTHSPAESGLEETESKPMQKSTDVHTRQRQPENLITPDQQLIIEPQRHYSQLAKNPAESSYFGFPIPGNRRQNIFLRDHTGRYNVRLQNLQGSPQNFQTALGTISAHILNHKSNQEYIPYPPNGNPYNYPAYRDHPRATEPPVISAYERASNSNYDVGSVDFNQQGPRRFLDYQPGFSNEFQSFGVYTPPEFLSERGLNADLRRDSYPINHSRWQHPREELQRPIK